MEIVRRSALKVVGLPVHATWEQLWIDMPNAWREFFSRCDGIANRIADSFIDVTLAQHGGRYHQLIAAEVSAIDRLPEGMTALEIPAQNYLHHRHEGPLHAVASSFGAMLDWARRNGCALDEFKLDFGYTRAGTETSHELYVKVS